PKPNFKNLFIQNYKFPLLKDLGFSPSKIKVQPFNISELDNYEITRDVPSLNSTSFLGPHLRFGTVSIRQVVKSLKKSDNVFLSELIWREFFIQIMFHFPRVSSENFKIKYNGIVWRNKEEEFEKWCNGKTGYPIVDAGIRQLNETGYMHNRVRMITASFLCKHLLIDWRWGEAYFAEKLLDFELSSNNGNWQWVAGTGCDAAPYFRVFSPNAQTLKFDEQLKYIKKWVPEFNEIDYQPMVEHKMARERALLTYKEGLGNILS
ncbi:MAG: deoxyribodipyrimidine photo-lyase, partial [Vicingaceae bacterium]|nr:deoxyribodipyrimidine photo-lyase [Vicingaceae bacterium]